MVKPVLMNVLCGMNITQQYCAGPVRGDSGKELAAIN
jgi:hypothetical protein